MKAVSWAAAGLANHGTHLAAGQTLQRRGKTSQETVTAQS